MARTADIIAGIIGTVSILLLFLALLLRSLKRTDDPKKLIVKWVATFVILLVGRAAIRGFPPSWWPGLCAVFAIPIGIIWTPSVAGFLFGPLLSIFDGGNEEPEQVPFYSIAKSKRGKGLYNEAIWEIRAQLEKFPGDFTGLMLIAAIQAENQKDIQGAEATIEHLLADTKRPPQAVASALHALADWELQIGQNSEAAVATLQRVVSLYPGSQLAQLASQRIARLETPNLVAKSHSRGPIPLPSGQKYVGLQGETQPVLPDDDPSALADGYVKQLEKHPLDWDAREKLAVLYAEHFQRFDLAEDQFEQLIAQPNQTPNRIARWLNLLATLYIKQKRDVPSAEKTLRRIIEKFPETAPAHMALARIATLGGELKGNETGPTKRLGSYEQNLGLKRPDE